MNSRTFAKSVHFLLVVAAALIDAFSSEIVVPNLYTGAVGQGPGLSAPFNRTDFRWQQVYSSSEFGAAAGDILRIDRIAFRIDEGAINQTFSVVVPQLNIFMGTSAQTFETASGTYSQNIQGSLFEVLPRTDLPMSGSRSSATSFDVVIPLPNAYQYDRRSGNLLVDIRVPSGSGLPFLDQQTGGMEGASFSIGGSINSLVGTKTSQGLITQFEYSVVPEPGIVWLIVFGSLCLLTIREWRKGTARSIIDR